MDDFLKLKLSKLTDKGRQEALEHLLGLDVAKSVLREMDFELAHISEFENAARERLKGYGEVIGLSSRYPLLDELTKGLVGGELAVVGGATSNGKTLLAINLAYNLANAGVPVLFVTLEMTHIELVSRLLKTHREGSLNDLPIYLQKRDELNWKSIDGLISAAIKKGVQAVFIDHLHYFSRELDNVAEDLGRITKEIKKNAIRHNLPVVLLSHARKTNGAKAVGNDDLRGSSYIAQDADIVLFIAKVSEDSRYRLQGRDSFVVRVTKNRNRGIPNFDTVQFAFDDSRLSEYGKIT